MNIPISRATLQKVNLIRASGGRPPVDETELRRLLDWTDLPSGPNLTRACLPRFSDVLGCRVESNPDGGLVYLCVGSQATARRIGAGIDGTPFHWSSPGPMAPRDYTGHSVLLPDDVVDLARQASREVLSAWRRLATSRH